MKQTDLLAVQWDAYPSAHGNRKNLLIHALTVPLFAACFLMLVAGPFADGWRAAAMGVAGMVVAIVAQGRGHRLERQPPAPFRGPTDVLARILAEQLVTFPRFVLSGAFARAWRAQSAEG